MAPRCFSASTRSRAQLRNAFHPPPTVFVREHGCESTPHSFPLECVSACVIQSEMAAPAAAAGAGAGAKRKASTALLNTRRAVESCLEDARLKDETKAFVVEMAREMSLTNAQASRLWLDLHRTRLVDSRTAMRQLSTVAYLTWHDGKSKMDHWVTSHRRHANYLASLLLQCGLDDFLGLTLHFVSESDQAWENSSCRPFQWLCESSPLLAVGLLDVLPPDFDTNFTATGQRPALFIAADRVCPSTELVRMLLERASDAVLNGLYINGQHVLQLMTWASTASGADAFMDMIEPRVTDEGLDVCITEDVFRTSAHLAGGSPKYTERLKRLWGRVQAFRTALQVELRDAMPFAYPAVLLTLIGAYTIRSTLPPLVCCRECGVAYSCRDSETGICADCTAS